MKKDLEKNIAVLWCITTGVGVLFVVELYRFNFDILDGAAPYVLSLLLMSIVALILVIRNRKRQLNNVLMGTYVEKMANRKLIMTHSILLVVGIVFFFLSLFYVILSPENTSFSKFILIPAPFFCVMLSSVIQLLRIRRAHRNVSKYLNRSTLK